MIRIAVEHSKDGLDCMQTTPFGSVIRAKRNELGLSQEELGARVGKDQSYISDIERGKNRRPDEWVVRRLAWELKIDEAYLFDLLGVGVKIGEGRIVAVRGLVPADSVRVTSSEGVTVLEVRVLPEDIRRARHPDEVYGLQVTGDCMRLLGILPGDVVIVEPAYDVPENGELVVVRIGDEVSLKRWSMFRDAVELRDAADTIVWRGKPQEVEVVALYVNFKPIAPR